MFLLHTAVEHKVLEVKPVANKNNCRWRLSIHLLHDNHYVIA